MARSFTLHPHDGDNLGVSLWGRVRSSAHSHVCALAPELGEEVHIGNFVEVKNSTMAKGAKATWPTWVMPPWANVSTYGAGAITAN